MPRFWIVDTDREALTWVEQTLYTLLPTAQVLPIPTQAAWEDALTHSPFPDCVITEYRLPWITAESVLQTLEAHRLPVPLCLFTDQASEEEIARLFEQGLHEYQPKTPRQPKLFVARLRRMLRHHHLSWQALFFQDIDEQLLNATDPQMIAIEALRALAHAGHAIWGASVIFNREMGDTAEILAAYNFHQPVGYRAAIGPPPLLPTQEGWTIRPIETFPEQPMIADAQARGVRWLGVYRATLDNTLFGLLYLGWRTSEQIIPKNLDFVAKGAQWLSAVVCRAIRLQQERATLRQMQTLTDLILSLNRSLDLETILIRLLAGLKEVVPYERSSVWLYNQDGELEIRYLQGYPINAQELQTRIYKYQPPPSQWPTTHYIAQTRQPLLIPDVSEYPHWYHTDISQEIRSWLGIPLVYDDRMIGLLTLECTEPNHFTPQHLQAAQTLASAAAIAIQNARLFQTEQQQRQALNALRLASLQLVSSLDVTEVLTTLLQQSVALTQADDAHIFLYNGEKLTFASAFWDGQVQDHPVSSPRPHGITYTVARTRKPKIVADTSRDPLFAGTPWHGAIISIPLIAHGDVLGVMNVAWHRPRRFRQNELDLLNMLADHAAIALENAHLVKRLQTKIKQLTTLSEASASLREATGTPNIANMLVQQALRLSDAQSALLSRFLGKNKEQAVIECVEGLSPDLPGRFYSTQKGIAGHLLRHNSPLVFRALYQSPLTQHPDWVEHIGPALALPLRTQDGDVVGMLLVGRPRDSKPFTEEEISPLQALAEIGATALQRAQAHERMEEDFMQTVLALSHAMDVRDTYHGNHSKRMAEWAVAIAREMGLSDKEIETIRLAALLHDIGKIGIPDTILLKPGPLDENEWHIMHTHPLIGAQILRPLKRLEPVAKIVETHHERWDGSGYPYGLKGEEIPLGARILAVVDSYGAMIDHRVYQPAIPHEEAVREIQKQAGKLYNPEVVKAFLAVVEYLGKPLT